MSVPRIPACLLIIVLLFVLMFAPNVRAQQTNISNLASPSTIVLLNGKAEAEVTFTVSYSGLPQDAWVAWGVSYANKSFVSTSLEEGDCTHPFAFCKDLPNSTSGTETGGFMVELTSAQQYSLVAVAGMVDKTGNLMDSTLSTQTFQINVVPSSAVSTSISNLEYPTQPVELMNGVGQANVTYTATYKGLPDGGALKLSIDYDNGTSYRQTGNSVTSAPDPCTLPGQKLWGNVSVPVDYAICLIHPSSSSGIESVSFTITFDFAGQYNLHGYSSLIDSSGYTFVEFNTPDFNITVSVSQPFSQLGVFSFLTQQYVLGGIVIAIVVLVFVLVQMRKRSPPPPPPPEY